MPKRGWTCSVSVRQDWDENAPGSDDVSVTAHADTPGAAFREARERAEGMVEALDGSAGGETRTRRRLKEILE